MSTEILVVEDDPALRNLLRHTAELGGFATREAGSGNDAIALAAEGIGDVVLLDLGLPDYDGRELLIVLRQITDNPILVVSGQGTDRDRVETLDLGADDYIMKPFLPAELLARIRAALRRVTPRQQMEQTLSQAPLQDRLPVTSGPYKLDPFDRSLWLGDKFVTLREGEYRIVSALALPLDRVVSRQELLEILYGHDPPGETRVVEVYISRIRTKLRYLTGGKDVLLTVRGEGWQMISPPATLRP